jgi:hypothetical protein
MHTLIPDYWFENILSPYFYIEISQQNFHVLLRELFIYILYLLVEAIPHTIAFILSCCLHIQNSILTLDMIPLCMKNPVPKYD